jgi:hypothetical protein
LLAILGVGMLHLSVGGAFRSLSKSALAGGNVGILPAFPVSSLVVRVLAEYDDVVNGRRWPRFTPLVIQLQMQPEKYYGDFSRHILSVASVPRMPGFPEITYAQHFALRDYSKRTTSKRSQP